MKETERLIAKKTHMHLALRQKEVRNSFFMSWFLIIFEQTSVAECNRNIQD